MAAKGIYDNQLTDYIYETAAGSITALAGGGFIGATPITAQTTRISVVASRGDSVRLPFAVPGLELVLVNDGANVAAVFPSGSDAINGQASGASVLQMPQSIDVYACGVLGKWHAEVGGGYSGSFLTELAEDNITATAGGGQTNARLLTSQTSRIVTVATAGDSIRLPVSSAGLELLIVNSGTNSPQVYGFGTDTIDSLPSSVGVSQMPSSMVIYSCTTAGAWFTNGIGTGYAGSFPTVSYVSALTAKAGGGQSISTPLTTVLTRVAVVATAGDSVTLPVAVAGMQVIIANASLSNSLNIFPNNNDAINSLAANAAFASAAGKNVSFYCMIPGFWHAILSA